MSTRQVSARLFLRAALETILQALSEIELPPADALLPPVLVARRNGVTRVPLAALPPHTGVRWEVLNDGATIAQGSGPARDCRLLQDLPIGTFTLRISFRGIKGPETHSTRLLVSPHRCCQGEQPEQRMWALAVQLYGVRSHRNWGHGDFTDLLRLIELAAKIGASGIGLNPLHALFDDRPEQASPYAPNSRLFLNPLYVDVEAIPEFPGVETARLTSAIERLRKAAVVDYCGVAGAKLAGLRLAYLQFRRAPAAERLHDFETFRSEQGEPLARFASFEVLRRRFPQVWWEWPPEWRNPSAEALAALRVSDGEAVGFYEFIQWIAARQLADCQTLARQRGLPIGLYLDVAVGVDAGGADAWSDQTAILGHLSAGAPPDLFNPQGQNWGIAGFHPRGLSAEGFTPFRRMIAVAMRHAGAIRIDHVLGLNRLFLIPHGATAGEGAYFRFPLQALLAVVAQESVDRRCIVIGEDLGTVPPELRTTLADWGIWTYRVMMFEQNPDGSFVPPDRYPRDALTSFNTHDLPTYAGWITGYDLDMRRAIGHPSAETDEQRRQSQEALRAMLVHAGCGGEQGFAAVARCLASTPSRLVVVAIEDVLGLRDQPNLPGTTDAHANWCQRLPTPLEDLPGHDGLRHLARLFAEAGRSMSKSD